MARRKRNMSFARNKVQSCVRELSREKFAHFMRYDRILKSVPDLQRRRNVPDVELPGRSQYREFLNRAGDPLPECLADRRFKDRLHLGSRQSFLIGRSCLVEAEV